MLRIGVVANITASTTGEAMSVYAQTATNYFLTSAPAWTWMSALSKAPVNTCAPTPKAPTSVPAGRDSNSLQGHIVEVRLVILH